VGSQWFVISRDFAAFLVNYNLEDPATPLKSKFLEEYSEYGKKVVVADENFFPTVLKNSPFCHKHFNDNFLHMQFDDWENEKNKPGQRDPSKCLMPNPNHCGRSPTTMTVDYLQILELSGALFARKFDEDVDSSVLDYIDQKRGGLDDPSSSSSASSASASSDPYVVADDVMIVQRGSIGDDWREARCIHRSKDGKIVTLKKCFENGAGKDVPLGKGWESGVVPFPFVEQSCVLPTYLSLSLSLPTLRLTHNTSRAASASRSARARPTATSPLPPARAWAPRGASTARTAPRAPSPAPATRRTRTGAWTCPGRT
jgi:hypothetical protein